MTLLLIGATGHVGAAILTEAAATSFHTPSAGEIFIVQKGVVHRPRADSEAKVLLIEPEGEPNSGDSDRAPSPKPRI